MTRDIKFIDQDLKRLTEAVATLTGELKTLYGQYLDLLGKAVAKQILLASYQICTQAYPEAFLQLSFGQRQQLQQDLRMMGKSSQDKLMHPWESLKSSAQSSLEEHQEEQEAQEAQEAQESETQSESEQLSAQPEDIPEIQSLEQLSDNLTNPEELVQWQQRLEKAITQTLQNISHQSNQILQTAQILPKQLPSQFLEAAIQAPESAQAISKSPNLLNLLVESGSKESSEKQKITQITAICLRLSEIEFSDTVLGGQRNQIQKMVSHLVKLQKQYHKLNREQALAQAELAWRASWYED